MSQYTVFECDDCGRRRTFLITTDAYQSVPTLLGWDIRQVHAGIEHTCPRCTRERKAEAGTL